MEENTWATGRAMGLNLTGTLKPYGDYALGKAQKSGFSKKAVEHFKIFRERLFFHISSLYPPTFGGKKHWLLVVEESTDFAWSNFLKKV